MNFRQFKKGQWLLISLDEGCYYGPMEYSTDASITLKKCINLRDGDFVLEGFRHFFSREILAVKVDTASQTTHSKGNILPEESIPDGIYYYQRFVNCYKNITYLWKIDSMYHKAIDYITNDSLVSIVPVGFDRGRFSEPNLLVIGTHIRCYIFDIQLIGAMNLKRLYLHLQSNLNRKIIHDGRKFLDYCKHVFTIKVNNISDTMLTHILLTSNDLKEISFEDTVSKFLKLPQGILRCDEDIFWFRRPFETKCLHYVTQKAQVLLHLDNAITREHLLTPFVQ